MICGCCGGSVDPQQRFCGSCGRLLSGGAGHAVSTGGGDIHGGLYQAGRDVVINPAPSTPAVAKYDYKAVPKWRSPFTQGILSWLGLALGLAGVFPFWKSVQPIFRPFMNGFGVPGQGSAPSWWLGLWLLLVFLFAIVWSLRSLTKLRLRKPLFPGWALSGDGGRITLEKIHAGECPQCGGKMRYYNKAISWRDVPDGNGGTRREVEERVPALECKRNPKHWVELDPAIIDE